MKVLHPKIWVITLKNEGFGFPWYGHPSNMLFHVVRVPPGELQVEIPYLSSYWATPTFATVAMLLIDLDGVLKCLGTMIKKQGNHYPQLQYK